MHTIIHIGAGTGRELDSYLDSGAARIVLVEPLPHLAAQLRQTARIAARQGVDVEIIEAAISTDVAYNQLHEFNLAEVSSLHRPSALKQLYPGLKLQQTHGVTTLSPGQLLDKHLPGDGQAALLVIQAPGVEVEVIQALIADDRLKQFVQLNITANSEPLYEGADAADTLLEALQGYGYDLVHQSSEDADWIQLGFRLSPLKHSFDAARDELMALKAQLAEVENKRAETHKWFMNRKEQALKAEEKVKALTQELARVSAERDQLQVRLEGQVSTREQLGNLENRIVSMLHAQNQQLHQNTNALGQHVTRMFKQNSCTCTAAATDLD